jgi:hypothetical protein
LRAKLKYKTGGWLLSGVTKEELEIEALKSLVFENTKSSSAPFMAELWVDQDQESRWP